ncbi:MAG TPA: hypothetical protein VK714_16535 [Myxococcota bacterium]|nr:hypothetical protein [Myxococcota bacterium]
MTAATLPVATKRWLFGPVPDLLLGCGLAYALLFALFCVRGAAFRNLFVPGLLPLLSVVGGTPHYGATLLRVYGERESRQKYFFFAVIATFAVSALFVAGLYQATIGSLLLSVYLTWSPWHYTGQNYGVALMFLGRRGVQIQAVEKRLIHLSFLLSYLLVFLSIHGVLPGANYAPIQYPGSYRFMTLGLPAALVRPAFALVAVAYAGLVLSSLGLLLRRASTRDVFPTAMLFVTQALWFSVPAVARHYGVLADVDPLSVEYVSYVFAWVAFGHALQYLWVTTYYAQGRRPLGQQLRYYGLCLASGAALWGIPSLVFRGPLEPRLGTASVFVMVLAVANIHHFILDGAIWKLRDGRVARILLRAPAPAPPPAGAAPRSSWFRRTIWVVGGSLAATTILAIVIGELGFRRSLTAGDLAAARSALSALAFFGRDDAVQHGQLADAAFSRGELALAGQQYEASLSRGPSSAGWLGLAQVAEQSDQWQRAAEAYTAAAQLDPAPAVLLYKAGAAWRRAGDPARAVPLLEEAVALEPDSKLIRSVLDLARRDASQQAGTAARDTF